jgi:S-DNA-T family DNA segregation ATPase FtsK/SpoIIIE
MPLPAYVVIITPDAPVDRGRLIQLSERAAGGGVVPVWATSRVSDLPAACRTWVELPADGEASANFVRLGTVIAPPARRALDAARFGVVAQALARITDIGDVAEDAGDVPRTIPLLQLLGSDMATSADAVIDRWTQNASIRATRSGAGYQPKRALVGQGAQGALHLDLRQQGRTPSSAARPARARASSCRRGCSAWPPSTAPSASRSCSSTTRAARPSPTASACRTAWAS